MRKERKRESKRKIGDREKVRERDERGKRIKRELERKKESLGLSGTGSTLTINP